MSFVETQLQKNGVFEITLNRPEVRNAFDPSMISDLANAFKQAELDKRVRVVLLSGRGESFCAGADLAWMKSMAQFTHEENVKDSHQLFEMFQAAAECSAPVIARLQGHVFGGALGLAATADVCLSESSTLFCFSEVMLGIAPAVISPFVMRKCEASQARLVMTSGVRFSAEEAQALGLVQEVVEKTEDLHARVQWWSDHFLKTGPEAVRETKKLLNSMDLPKVLSAKAEVCKVIADRRVSDEGQEGLASFFEKRQPKWRES